MTATASRFAILRIDDDEEERRAQSLRDKQKAAAQKQSGKTGNSQNKHQAAVEKNAAHKGKMSQEKAELRSLAFGGTKPKKSSSKKKASTAEPPIGTAEWSEWKKRDQMFVEGSYEQQLAEALMASKLEFEEKRKANGDNQAKMTVKDPEPLSKKKPANKKGTTTMTLDEFNRMSEESKPQSTPAPAVNGKAVTEDEGRFFEQMSEEAKKLAGREKSQTGGGKKKTSKPLQTSTGAPRLAQLEEELQQSQAEVETLRAENAKLQEDLLAVKKRSKRLCNILAQGEMKEKAELLVEIEKRTKVEDELMAEVDKLSKQLEQERSKVTALSDAKKAAANRK